MTDAYEPPPGAAPDAHDPQLAWLKRQLHAVPARSASRSTWREPASADVADVVETDVAGDDDDEAMEEHTRARPRRRALATDTALIPRVWVTVMMVWLVRALMLSLLVASFVGSIASFNPAGIAPVLAAFPWLRLSAPWLVVGANRTAALLGVGLQLWITGVEYWKAPHRLRLRRLLAHTHWFYTMHLGLDVALTVYGWRPVVLPWLVVLISQTLSALDVASVPVWLVRVAAYGLLGLLGLGCALLPERVLLRD